MPTSYEETSNRVMAQLHNAKNIAIKRQNRRLAIDVLKACSLYVQGTQFPCDPKMFEQLAESIIDKRDTAIIEAFAKVEKVIVEGSRGVQQQTWLAILPQTR
jgi:hypothetical protein